MLHFVNDDVAYDMDEVRCFSKEDLEKVAQKALANPSGKFRICYHKSAESKLHEMLIGLRNGYVYPPHRNCATEETHFMLLGTALLEIYAENGQILRQIQMGDLSSGMSSYVRIPLGTFHCMTVLSPVVVYLETKMGPFDPQKNETAPWV